jgi:hypothetical protein
MTNKDLKFYDSDYTIDENTDGLVIQRYQEIPQDFLDNLKRKRDESMNVREQNYMHVASIPVEIVEKWQREGFDFQNESVRKIVAKLKSENLDAFLVTNKAV